MKELEKGERQVDMDEFMAGEGKAYRLDSKPNGRSRSGDPPAELAASMCFLERNARSFLVLAAICALGRQVSAQHVLEVRGASTKYRYLDWNYSFPNSAIVDLFYVGVPESNEFNLGAGYGFKVKPELTIATLIYAVLAKEGSQRGVKIAVLVVLEKDGWKLNGFLGQFVPVAGEISHYQVLDTLDFSRVISKRWEAGISKGFFHTGGRWNPQVGPLAKLNDRLGYWAVSYRFGPQREFRVARVLFLGK